MKLPNFSPILVLLKIKSLRPFKKLIFSVNVNVAPEYNYVR